MQVIFESIRVSHWPRTSDIWLIKSQNVLLKFHKGGQMSYWIQRPPVSNLYFWSFSEHSRIIQLSLNASFFLFFSLLFPYLSRFIFTSDSPMFLPIVYGTADVCPIDFQNVLLISWSSRHLSDWVCLKCETLQWYLKITKCSFIMGQNHSRP